MKEIEQLMLQYPIMEMVQEEAKKTGTLQWSWVKRDYFNIESSKLDIENTPENAKISILK